MKKAIRREFRRFRRKLAQYILGFETCPRGYMKNRGLNLLKLLGLVAATSVGVGLFLAAAVWLT